MVDFRVKSDTVDELEHLSGDILGSKAEFLVKHLVGSRSAETVESVDHSVGAYHATQGRGESGGEPEDRHSCGNHAAAVFFILALEETH